MDGKVIILRHDVDRMPENSLRLAKLEAESGITGTYFFRTVKESWDEKIIKEISSLGHEIGYHYEDIVMAASKYPGIREEKELAGIAIRIFRENLDKIRGIAPVKTICMHGSPASQWDSRLLWKYYNYLDFGLEGEPYFDTDFNTVLYLTDTGRRWNGDSVNVRDKTDRTSNMGSLQFHTTYEILEALAADKTPDKIMMNFHPHRWNDPGFLWLREAIWQNIKNIGKYLIVSLNRS